MTLAGKTLFVSGGSRGIGLAIAMRAARDGANVALIAKTAEPHPKGVTDFGRYAYQPGTEPEADLFVDHA
ncbi:MAG TPA: SDR family NAD(P)-dependent oxidoreductase [Streptosporangiaceae bacterium]|jgi:NAD(P)-dependent dehydrogenase (short-subunit alcohol dehydrogenase family)|nr:SDR family NAD(P)-dependent oxidoreductase [Streptosporangiaceae bacterium]